MTMHVLNYGRNNLYKDILLTSEVVKVKSVFENNPGFQTQNEDWCLKSCILGDYPKNNSTEESGK